MMPGTQYYTYLVISRDLTEPEYYRTFRSAVQEAERRENHGDPAWIYKLCWDNYNVINK